MNEKYISDKSLLDDKAYQDFLKENPSYGFLKIRASAANEAVPISNIKIKVSKEIGNNNVIFYEGITDESGMINNIKLPSPVKITSDLEKPKFTDYKLTAINEMENIDKEYTISICCGITVIQYINIIPKVSGEIR